MNFDKTMKSIYNLLEKLFNSKKKSKNIKKILKSMILKKEITTIFSIFMLKITIIIISYYPEKSNLIYKLFYTLYKLKSESKNLLLDNLVTIIEENPYDDELDDEIMDKIIFNTFGLLESCNKIDKNGTVLFITILNEIIINLKKVKLQNETLISQIYLMFIRKSNNLVLNSKEGQVYLKIMEMCGVTIRMINGYIK